MEWDSRYLDQNNSPQQLRKPNMIENPYKSAQKSSQRTRQPSDLTYLKPTKNFAQNYVVVPQSADTNMQAGQAKQRDSSDPSRNQAKTLRTQGTERKMRKLLSTQFHVTNKPTPIPSSTLTPKDLQNGNDLKRKLDEAQYALRAETLLTRSLQSKLAQQTERASRLQ